ncbi:hypothetical protein [Halorarum halobium]|uniref:hypothetical protein n=1 Tax=Halorarum halobium TaxID=3075121 RepID=UPI0028B1D4EB|nr:hypothetical protein [Halobaculum sp. XH14]
MSGSDRPGDGSAERSPASPTRLAVVGLSAFLALASVPVAGAHVGGLGGTMGPVAVPTWLVITTGGGVVGASFLFTSLLTDRGPMHAVAGWRADAAALARPAALARRALQVVGVLGLAATLVSGLVGPLTPTANLAVLLVWGGWWAGFTMTTYLAGDSWPAVNPWRTLAGLLPALDREYPERWGAWPSVVGLLALVWVEVVSPVSDDPRLLVALVVAYTLLTLAGAATFGRDVWFANVDPVARVFRWYGRLAPIQRTEDGLELVVPGAGLVRTVPEREDGPAFVVALLWVTTFDGLVTTPLWAAVAGPLVDAGVPSWLLSLVALAGGFVLFYAALLRASTLARGTADSYVTAEYVRRALAPSLVPIAAGYHLAHYLGYFLGLAPALAFAIANPLGGITGPTLLLPDWFGALRLSFVVLGHLVAVAVAHVVVFEVFPGRLQPIRSQYPFIVLMILYTMTSMWILTQPFVQPV